MSTAFEDIRPVVRSSVLEQVERTGPVLAFSSARSLRMRCRSASGQLGQSFRRWRIPCFLCGSLKHIGTTLSFLWLSLEFLFGFAFRVLFCFHFLGSSSLPDLFSSSLRRSLDGGPDLTS